MVGGIPRPRAAAKKAPLPAGSATIAFSEQQRKCANGYHTASGRSRKAPLGELIQMHEPR